MYKKSKSTRAFFCVTLVVTWVALCLITVVWPASANTFTVTNTRDNGGVNPAPGAGTGTLRQAIVDVNANAGPDTINFPAGFAGTITLESELPQITQDVTINGTGAGMVTVSGASAFRVFSIGTGVTASISGLTISNGNAPPLESGGGIFALGADLTVTNCIFSGNHTDRSGGGIGIDGAGLSTLTVTNCTFSGNSAGAGGGIHIASENVSFMSTATVTNCTFSGNSASSAGGGGISSMNGQTLTVTNCTFSGNSTNGSFDDAVFICGGTKIIDAAAATSE